MNVGEDVFISDHAVIRRPHLVTLGDHVAIDEFVVITTELIAGSYIHISPHVSIIGGEQGLLVLGSFCTIAAGSRIICRSDSFSGNGLVSTPNLPEEYKNEVMGNSVCMDNFSSICTNVVIGPSVWLAEGVVVGANSLVLSPIDEPWTVWAGSPARKIKNRPKEVMKEYARKLGYV